MITVQGPKVTPAYNSIQDTRSISISINLNPKLHRSSKTPSIRNTQEYPLNNVGDPAAISSKFLIMKGYWKI